MRLIIAGSRGITRQDLVRQAAEEWVREQGRPSLVLCGGAKGPDMLGKSWALTQVPPIPVKNYPADWVTYGVRAGAVRNIEMAENADGLLALWDGYSRGTDHMIKAALKRGRVVVVWLWNGTKFWRAEMEPIDDEGFGVL